MTLLFLLEWNSWESQGLIVLHWNFMRLLETWATTVCSFRDINGNLREGCLSDINVGQWSNHHKIQDIQRIMLAYHQHRIIRNRHVELVAVMSLHHLACPKSWFGPTPKIVWGIPSGAGFFSINRMSKFPIVYQQLWHASHSSYLIFFSGRLWEFLQATLGSTTAYRCNGWSQLQGLSYTFIQDDSRFLLYNLGFFDIYILYKLYIQWRMMMGERIV